MLAVAILLAIFAATIGLAGALMVAEGHRAIDGREADGE